MLKPISHRKLIRVLNYLGFTAVRQKGSHLIFTKNSKMVVVPIHTKEIGRGLLRTMIDDMEISKKEFYKILEKI
ncbi:type II toxin-antitoxin system HicA family toxin [Candidatus Micrarchaeota archaeon]|nr:type II toxin-antitoxin system HicA family toxin [Candidatus Micrarchaeota archaeon]